MTFQCAGQETAQADTSPLLPSSSHPWGVWALLVVSPSQSGFVPSAHMPWVGVLGTQGFIKSGSEVM